MNLGNEDVNMMANYFMHSSQIQNQSQYPNDENEQSNIFPNQNINQNNNNMNINNNLNSQMNSSFESTMTNPNQMNLNNEILNDLTGKDFQNDKKLNKILKTFKKNIKLRNATIKKNFWKRDYISSKILNITIGSLFPLIEPSQGFCQCIYNYMNNKQFMELICKVENEIITKR